MRTAEQKILWVMAVIGAAVIGGPFAAFAQEGEAGPDSATDQTGETAPVIETGSANITFTEIQLFEDGARATDTSGEQWLYDFERDTWVAGGRAAEGEAADRIAGQDEVPVERRAMQQRMVVPGEETVTIGYDEYVDGSVLVSGRVTVKGWVRGDVRSIAKRVLVTETGQVDGDVEAPSVVVKPGGRVLGEIHETGGPLDPSQITEGIAVNGIVVVTALTGLLLFVGFLAVASVPANVNRIRGCIAAYRVRSYLLGLLVLFLLPVIAVLFIITILGILLLPVLPVIYLAAISMGFIAFAGMVGKRVLATIPGQTPGAQMSTFVGMALQAIVWLLVILFLGSTNAFLSGLGVALLVIAIAVTSFPVCTGIGASFLTRFGRREYVSWRERRPPDLAPAPAPPPLNIPPMPIPPLRPERRDRE